MTNLEEKEKAAGRVFPVQRLVGPADEPFDPDDRRGFETWVTDNGRWLQAAKRSGETYLLMQSHVQWQGWKARGNSWPNAEVSGVPDRSEP